MLCGEGFCCLEHIDHGGVHLWALRLHESTTQEHALKAHRAYMQNPQRVMSRVGYPTLPYTRRVLGPGRRTALPTPTPVSSACDVSMLRTYEHSACTESQAWKPARCGAGSADRT